MLRVIEGDLGEGQAIEARMAEFLHREAGGCEIREVKCLNMDKERSTWTLHDDQAACYDVLNIRKLYWQLETLGFTVPDDRKSNVDLLWSQLLADSPDWVPQIEADYDARIARMTRGASCLQG